MLNSASSLAETTDAKGSIKTELDERLCLSRCLIKRSNRSRERKILIAVRLKYRKMPNIRGLRLG